jgi:CBS domain-containing protein
VTRDPQSISPDATVEEALQRMIDGNFRHLPVVDEGRLVGMLLSMRDISRLQMKGE